MRLIDADKFDEKYIEIKVGNGFAEDEEISAKDVVYFQALALDALPTIDAVPVVRCKDCKHWGEHDVAVPGETDKIKACGWALWMIGENGYCLYGERKDNAVD